MILSRRWLEAMLGRPLDPADLEQRLSMLGVPVEAIVPIHQDLGDVVIGAVLEVKKHPNADRLSLCLVNAGNASGGSAVEVVCGAPNVEAGKKYPYAPVGAVLPGGLKLERKKIRGVESNGMLCSARELGLGTDHAGILELDTDAAPGTRFLDVMPIADHQLVIEVTANRPDMLCHKGVARELAASLGATLKLPPLPASRGGGPAPSGGHAGFGGRRRPAAAPAGGAARAAEGGVPAGPSGAPGWSGVVDGVEVRLEDPEGAPRYMIAVIRGVKVGISPQWLADRLASIGQRPINNVVDATNYILFELNQPLHAFDRAKLRGPAVVVRRARTGEKIVTLDGVERTLTPEMTAICDAERPTIVAGVMGSAESEVTDATTDLVLECAYFQPTRIRRTRRALELSSESSYRFERGIDLLGMPDALRRAIDLILAVAGGEVREPALDLWPKPVEPTTIFLRPERIGGLLGVPIERGEIEQRLSSIGFVVAPKEQRLAVQVPGWRPDVTREVDLTEEVARLKGYDAFPDELRPYCAGTVPDAPLERAKGRVRVRLAEAGLYEARTFPLGPADGPDAPVVQNPMSADEAHLRMRLLPGLVRRVEHNWAARNRDVRLFEVGTVFRKRTGDVGRGTGVGVEEWTSVAGVITGARQPRHWSDGAKSPDMDIWDLKHHFDLAVSVAAPGSVVQPAADGAVGWVAVQGGKEVVGHAGPLEADAPPWAGALFGWEVRLEVADPRPVAYQALPGTPLVERDLALVLPPGVTAAAVEAAVRRAAGPLLESLVLFDEYRGPGVPSGHRSVAWRCTFRDPSRTLREAEVDAAVGAALEVLEGELGVRRRAS
ncbi:MAG TPA: phenylalanine--tRNA ligase subunit beta [Gemmatimonadales bacterium]|nr:phenylalanine--tRNA ligase subunit beta [Gemmatimonadales bacterium]